MNRKFSARLSLLAFALTLLAAPAMYGATHCVNQNGSRGCFSSISAAVAAAGPGDVIQVERGTYNEDVIVSKPLSLIGQDRENTVIDAVNRDNGVNIDGNGNPGLSHVVVSGFTVKDANFAGVLITNASAVTISSNRVLNNDRSLAAGSCPGLPSFFEAGEAIDCGEGIQLSGVDHSTIAGNVVERNAGGILIADDTGATHDNVITGDEVRNNKPDCGITLASHSGAGVFRNAVSLNDSAYNGGAGVGIFAPGPGTKDYANVVMNNRITGNGQPGVTMHNHAAPGVGGVPPVAPAVVFSDNVIVGNIIARNAADTADAATSGTTGINLYSLAPMPGTIIDQNTILEEDLDVALKVPASASASTPDVQVHLNNLLKNVGIENAGTASIDATENWWGCSGGPTHRGCSTVAGANILYDPWLTRPNSPFVAPSSRD
jgi:Right handed beta helix region